MLALVERTVFFELLIFEIALSAGLFKEQGAVDKVVDLALTQSWGARMSLIVVFEQVEILISELLQFSPACRGRAFGFALVFVQQGNRSRKRRLKRLPQA
jgi:hypothetical protein